jgi:2-hydroxychromene-2-carboxylate isomerase
MGDLIVLADRRARRAAGGLGMPDSQRIVGGPAPPVAFFFDLGCPFSYLAAERIVRTFGHATWIPVAGSALYRAEPLVDLGMQERAVARAEQRATELRVPLVWPDRFPVDSRLALRAAAYATETGAGAEFALAASRLAFCGGFDLEELEILAEAAAAAGIRPDACMAAAGDKARDEVLEATARRLLSRGVAMLPALHVGSRWFGGERRLSEAAAVAREAARPLVPVG